MTRSPRSVEEDACRYGVQYCRRPSRPEPGSPYPRPVGFLGIPYTGSDPLTLSLTLDKSAAKRVLVSEGIPTPRSKKVGKTGGSRRLLLRYPLFVKLCYEGSSKGVRLDSKVWDVSSLRKRQGGFWKPTGPPVLVEEFIQGPEFTVGILGNDTPSVLGVMQIEIRGVPSREAIYSLEVKREWEEKVQYLALRPIDASLLMRIEEVALRSYQALECSDVSRVDIRMGVDGEAYFLEVNPLPGLSPVYGDLPIMAGGWDGVMTNWSETIFQHALKRYGLEVP